ncbi:tetratricopeptide repeat protein [Polynucleobacter sp. 73C-SIWE]|uniref:tetratricopeptide repeat protein n=1 Tax=Polynucleobacter sp. 73C-SIWE TaxID=2689098 RepID=UPI001C0CDD0D|nr:tetratricopeptide repeat protein [Polynucleobacter sp. 73C-SIWE]MBU3579524.1 tetratricopeptide repeat protein [Polynucleobacter sp. 73C-SIWE]
MNQLEQKQLIKLAEHYFQSNHYQLAKDVLKIIINTDPSNSKANELLAYIYENQGDRSASYRLLELACTKDDCSPEALYYLGSAQLEKSLYDEASITLQKSIKKAGVFFEALHDLGTAYGQLGKIQEALLCYEDCLKLNQGSHELHYNIARCLDDLKRYDEALTHYDRAIELKPDYASAWYNKGVTLHDLKRYDEALTHYDRAIELKPDFFDSHWNKALTCLVLEDFENGWNFFDYRWKKIDADHYRHYEFRELETLENIAEKNILVSHEQGLGDTIQFFRYIPKLIELGAHVTFKTQKPLLNLLSHQIECVTTCEIENNSQFDFQVPLLTLPKLFKTNITNIPPSIDLKINNNEILKWRNQLNLSKDKLNIGLAVSGSPIHKNDLNRSMPLEYFSSLFHFGKFFLIQKQINNLDKEVLSQHKEVIFLGDEINDFVDTASIIQNMDLIISVDTSLIHLAGTLNKESFLMLPWCPEWRWFLDKAESPWYPSIAIYRQKSPGDWDSVVAQIKTALEKNLD